jgi:hypothetical protein
VRSAISELSSTRRIDAHHEEAINGKVLALDCRNDLADRLWGEVFMSEIFWNRFSHGQVP